PAALDVAQLAVLEDLLRLLQHDAIATTFERLFDAREGQRTLELAGLRRRRFGPRRTTQASQDLGRFVGVVGQRALQQQLLVEDHRTLARRELLAPREQVREFGL